MESNGLTEILVIVLSVMIVILIALVFTYLILSLKNRTKKEKTKTKGKGNKDDKGVKQTTNSSAYNKQSIFDFMEFDKVEDNMIVQKNGKRYIMAIECQGVNYDLMSDIEKISVEEGFQQFLNTLRHPVQIYIQTRTINLEKSIQTYKNKVNEIEIQYNRKMFEYNQMVQNGNYSKQQLNRAYYELTKQRNLFEYAKDIVDNTEKMSLNRNILSKRYYVIISYMPEEASSDTYDKEELRNIAFSELYTKAQAIIRTLSACSVSGKILNSSELIELLYTAYNRDDSEIYGLDKALKAEYYDLYSTAPDVFQRKVQALDAKIQQEAVNVANDKIERIKAKSRIQKMAEEREESMDDLISQMAQILLEENRRQVGNEIADKAIEELKKEEKERKGGNANEEIKKTTRGRRSTKQTR